MIRINRRLFVDGAAVGVLLTCCVAIADLAGWLGPLEWWLYDRRAEYCQFFQPPPTDKLAHLDVDDAALETIGSWPWPRSRLGEIIDELRLASPKAVALDVIFSEPQGRLVDDLNLPDQDEVFAASLRRLPDQDAVLAASLRRLGCALVPYTVPFVKESVSPLQQAVTEQLRGDLELSEEQIIGLLPPSGMTHAELARQVDQVVPAARNAAMFDRIKGELENRRAPVETIQKRLLPNANAGLDTPLLEVFSKQYDSADATLRLRTRFAKPLPPGIPPLFHSEFKMATIGKLSDAAVASGFVDNPFYPDGKVRSIPLFVEADGGLCAQMGFALSCMMLDAPLSTVRLGEHSVTIPREGRHDIVIPVRTYRSATLGQRLPMLMDIPWFGGREWESMYDPHNPALRRNHFSINAVWDACLTQRKILANNKAADGALKFWLDLLGEKQKLKELADHPGPDNDPLLRLELISTTLKDAEPWVEQARQTPEKERRPEDQLQITTAASLGNALQQNPALKAQLDAKRAQLKNAFGGKAILLGWTATGAIADFVPTSLHAKCPGVVLHGAIFNGIMTGELWRWLPRWVTVLITIALGLVMTAAVRLLPPTRALMVALALAIGYLLINGLWLFDYGNHIAGIAGPLLAIALAWQGGTLIRFLVERWERARIEGRFRSYVDPALVDYVVDHPEQINLAGQIRELTVVFTDLAGFTKLTAKLGERTVPLLNEYMGLMAPIIRRHKGYRNKFLGDGIMFFFNAPELDADHARNAVATILDMQAGVREFNQVLSTRGLPPLSLRAGVSTGSMVVGDAGSKEASDYTVLGDYVNLGARLESANKSMGTRCLMTERTIQLAGDGFLTRPIGRLCVVGREDSVMTFEALNSIAQASDQEKRLAAATREVVETYLGAKLTDCLAALARMEQEFGADKLTSLYRGLCEEHLSRPTLDGFDCQIVLSEK